MSNHSTGRPAALESGSRDGHAPDSCPHADELGRLTVGRRRYGERHDDPPARCLVVVRQHNA